MASLWRTSIAAFSGTLLLAAGAWCDEGSAPGEGRAYASASAVQPLQPGARVPDASVRTVDGAQVDLAEAIRGSGALLVFYRGGW